MICPYCNSQLSNDTKFCPYCDADLSFSMSFGEHQNDMPAAEPPQPDIPQDFQPNAPQGFQPNMPQGFQPDAPQGFQPNMPQGFQPNMPQGFQPNMPQGFQPNTVRNLPPGPMPFQAPPSSGKKWVIPTVIGVLAAAAVVIGIAIAGKSDKKKTVSTADSSSSVSTAPAVTVAPETSSVAFDTTSVPPADLTDEDDSAEWLDQYYLPKGLSFGMSIDEATAVMKNQYAAINSEPLISNTAQGDPIYEYFFSAPPASLGEYGTILDGREVSIELFFEDDELTQVDVWSDAEYDEDLENGYYGASLTDTLTVYNSLQLGVKGFGDSEYEPYPFGEENGNYHTHTYINDDADRALRINYIDLNDDYYSAYYSYFCG